MIVLLCFVKQTRFVGFQVLCISMKVMLIFLKINSRNLGSDWRHLLINIRSNWSSI